MSDVDIYCIISYVIISGRSPLIFEEMTSLRCDSQLSAALEPLASRLQLETAYIPQVTPFLYSIFRKFKE